MTVTLELEPEEVAALHARAQADGVDIEAVLHGLVAQMAPAPAPDALSAPVERPPDLAKVRQAWHAQAPTDDPEELAARDQELEEFAANISRWRADQGQPAAF